MRAACLALPFVLSAALPAQAGPLLPHRAVYDLALENASDRSGITGIAGRMVYEFNGSHCDGYTVKFRFVTQIDTPDITRITDQQTTTFEDGDGKTFNFVTRSFVDSVMDKEVRGSAKTEGSETVVSLEKPEKQEFALEKTQFPTQHLLELLDNARKGETFYETTLFDGSEDADRIMTTTVIIGKGSPPAANDPERKAIKTLADDEFWPVDIAYFDLKGDQGEEIPTYRISFKLHESGITRDLVMDYGDFSMTGTLVDLALFEPAKDCAQ
jgi:hypothetical protein